MRFSCDMIEVVVHCDFAWGTRHLDAAKLRILALVQKVRDAGMSLHAAWVKSLIWLRSSTKYVIRQKHAQTQRENTIIISSAHLHILTSSSPLVLLPSCPLLFSLSLLKARGSVNETARNATPRFQVVLLSREPFRTKWGSIATKTEVKLQFPSCPANPFARNEVRSPKPGVKLRFASCSAQPFRTKWGSIAKSWSKIAVPLVPSQPFRPNEVRSLEAEVKLRFQIVPFVPKHFRTKWGSIAKSWGKIAISKLSRKPLYEMRFDRQKLR